MYRHRQQRLAIHPAFLAGAGAAALALAGRALLRHRRYLDLRGRTVLITGGSRGLGLVLARQAVREGARVAICARDEAELQRARDELGACGADVLAVQCDLTIPAQVNGMVEGLIKHFGAIDVLINNAGVITVGPIEEMTLADFEQAMQIHFAAPLHTIMAVLPSMRARRLGRIVNITSIGGKVPVPHLVPYCASKYALAGLSESLRTELIKDGIYVTTVVPGLMRTGSPRHVAVKGRHREEYAWFVTGDVTPGLSIDPQRVARRVVRAAQYGQSSLIMPLVAQLAARAHGLAPGLSMELAGFVSRFLPDPGGIGTQRATGHQSESELIPAFARQRQDQAAAANNEILPSPAS